jgi:hypothetical protein
MWRVTVTTKKPIGEKSASASPTRTGRLGYDLLLDAVPVSGRIVVRTIEDKVE